MSSKILYDKIYNSYIDSIKIGKIETDKFLSSKNEDKRRGISLIIPVPFNKIIYSSFVDAFRSIETEQYYYPLSDLHITIFTFLSARDTYKINAKLENEFVQITEKALNNINQLLISFSGLTFSKKAGFINGYDNNALILIRDCIRTEMNKKGLNIDERYKSETAHVTFMRFKNEISNIDDFYNTIANKRNEIIEDINLSKIELVEHDWYNTESNKRIISTFNTKSS